MTEEELSALDTNSYIYSLLKGKAFGKTDPSEKIELSVSEHDHKTLKDLDVRNGDVIVVESNAYVNQLFENKLAIAPPAPDLLAKSTKQVEVKFLVVDEKSDLELHKLTSVEERENLKDIRFLALCCLNSDYSAVNLSQIQTSYKLSM